MKAVIIGAGWSGLAAAVALSAQGHQVTVLEAGRQLGGRARTLGWKTRQVDNGQHLLLGACNAVLTLLDRIGIEEASVFHRQPMELLIKSPGDQNAHIQAANLAYPWNLLGAALSAKHLSPAEKWAMTAYLWTIARQQPFTEQSLSDTLVRSRQPKSLITRLWEPLCLAALNTPAAQASTEVFNTLLYRVLLQSRRGSDWLLPRVMLSNLLPVHAERFLQKQNCQILKGQRILELTVSRGSITAARSRNSCFRGDVFIIATAAPQCARLLNSIPVLKPLSDCLLSFDYYGVATAYFYFGGRLTPLPCPIVGLLQCRGQWVFDRQALTGEKGCIAVVRSAMEADPGVTKAQELKLIEQELRGLFAIDNPLEGTLLMKQARAGFSATPNINERRPDNRTSIENLFIAGDYTRTGLPATLESAVQSANLCISMIT